MPEAQRWGQCLGIINQFYLIFTYFLRAVHEQDEFNPALLSKAKPLLEYLSSTASPGFLNHRKYSNCSTYFSRQLQSHFWFWTRQSLQCRGQNPNRLCPSKSFPGRLLVNGQKIPYTANCVLSRSVVSDPLWPYGLKPIKVLCPWDVSGKNTGVRCHFLFQGIISYVSCIAGGYFTGWTIREAPAAAAAAKSRQSCPTLCDPIDGSPPGSAVPGILQARTLEWAAISFSNAWKWKVKVKSLSRVRLCATPQTAAHQAPPSMGFPRQEYWSGVPLPSPREAPMYCQNHEQVHCFSLHTPLTSYFPSLQLTSLHFDVVSSECGSWATCSIITQ